MVGRAETRTQACLVPNYPLGRFQGTIGSGEGPLQGHILYLLPLTSPALQLIWNHQGGGRGRAGSGPKLPRGFLAGGCQCTQAPTHGHACSSTEPPTCCLGGQLLGCGAQAPRTSGPHSPAGTKSSWSFFLEGDQELNLNLHNFLWCECEGPALCPCPSHDEPEPARLGLKQGRWVGAWAFALGFHAYQKGILSLSQNVS